MQTREYFFKTDKGKEFSIIAPDDIFFTHSDPMDYEDCCGAGEGLGERIVPDTIWGLKISLACFVHDDMFERGEKTWAHFHQSNSIFLKNIINIIHAYSKSRILKHLRLYRAVSYYNAVDRFGKRSFKK
jgi:hypothetical protein